MAVRARRKDDRRIQSRDASRDAWITRGCEPLEWSWPAREPSGVGGWIAFGAVNFPEEATHSLTLAQTLRRRLVALRQQNPVSSIQTLKISGASGS
jgi:hypothetical protein